jgi:hypothetical protein
MGEQVCMERDGESEMRNCIKDPPDGNREVILNNCGVASYVDGVWRVCHVLGMVIIKPQPEDEWSEVYEIHGREVQF